MSLDVFIERLKELERSYNILTMPFPLIVFDYKELKFKTPSCFLENPFEIVVLKRYSQFKYIPEDYIRIVKFYTTIEEDLNNCKYKGKTKDELKKYYKLTYQTLLLSLVKEKDVFEPYIILLIGRPLANFIDAFAKRKYSFSTKYVVRDIVSNGSEYNILIETQNINESDAKQILDYVEPKSPNNVITQFEAYRKAFNNK